MKHTFTILALILLVGCSTTVETEFRQPWTIYKTRADIVPIPHNFYIDK